MKRIALLTESFPFPPGEQFLEEEMKYWGSADACIVVLPARAAGRSRTLPTNATVDTCLAQPINAVGRLRQACLTAGSRIFRDEMKALIRLRHFSPAAAWSVFRNAARIRILGIRLEEAWRRHGPFDVIYSYWNDTASYAAAVCKKTGWGSPLVVRAHGFDVYEELRPGRYMPFKREVNPVIDLVCPISEATKQYMLQRYGLDGGRVRVERLGVQLPEVMSLPSDGAGLRVVSISSCAPVKRLDKVIGVVAELAKIVSYQIHWTHIGGGPGLNGTIQIASSQLGSLRNVSWDFVGHVSHDEVRRFIQGGRYDVILNLSESEGVPVSVMEAMSFGVPPIATAVGGVGELVSDDCGKLVDPMQSEREIARIVADFTPVAKSGNVRQRARARVQACYNASTNYPEFIAMLCAMTPDSDATPRPA